MTLLRRIHRQYQLLITVTRTLIIHILPRHLNQPLLLIQPPPLMLQQFPAPVRDPIEICLLLVNGPGMPLVARYGRVLKRPIILRGGMPLAVRSRHEVSRGVVPAAVLVLREGVFHAVVVHEVCGVVVVVVVFVAPEVALEDLAGLDAVAAGCVLAVAVAGRDDLARFEGGHAFVGGFAVAECGAGVVAVGAGERAFADEAGDVFGCEDSVVDLVAPPSWLDWGGEDGREDDESSEEEGDWRHC